MISSMIKIAIVISNTARIPVALYRILPKTGAVS